METTEHGIQDKQLDILARILLPEIKKFFADEEIQIEFQQWQRQRRNDKQEQLS